MTIVLWVVVVLLLVAFGVFLWKSSETWGVTQIVFTLLTLLTGMTLLPMLAYSLKTRNAWQKQVKELRDEFAKLDAEVQRLQYGDVLAVDQAEDALLPLQSRLRALQFGVGRVWRSLALAGGDANGFQLKAVAGAPALPGVAAAAPAAAPKKLDIPEGLVLYAFADGLIENQMLPVFFLGEFKAASVAGDTLTLVPTRPLLPAAQQVLANNQAPSWTLYELPPSDSHEPFLAEGAKGADDLLFGNVNVERIQQLLSQLRPETLKSYLETGRRAVDGDPPQAIWTKVEFLQDTEIIVDNPEKRSAIDGGFFDGSGLAVDARLQRPEGESVKFKVGDQLVIKAEAAQDLIQRGQAKQIDNYYVRPLNDYGYALNAVPERLAQLAQKIDVLNREMGLLAKVNEQTDQVQLAAQQEQVQLEAERNQMLVEGKALEAYTQQIEQRLNDTNQRLKDLYANNVSLQQQLVAIQSSIVSMVQAREQAVSTTP
jgi:hypothetical protein